MNLMILVLAFARKTGDYAVLSTTDLGVIALTLQCHMRENGGEGLRLDPGSKGVQGPGKAVENGKGGTASADQSEEKVGENGFDAETSGDGVKGAGTGSSENDMSIPTAGAEDEEEVDEQQIEDDQSGIEDEIQDDTSSSEQPSSSTTAIQMNDLTLSDPPSSGPSHPSAEGNVDPVADSDSDAGEWITPSNVSKHRSRDLGYLPEGGQTTQKEIVAACMTGDFAVQNVLLAMGLGLVGEGGKRINKVKSWVLRCHACFK